MTNENEDIIQQIEDSSELAEEIYDVIDGEPIPVGLRAIQMVIMLLITNNCVDRNSADIVLNSMHESLKEVLEMHDNLRLCVWHQENTLN